ncbi:MAG: ubiquinol-cytochrome c reductase iron-sulfur subunit [Fibrobacteria bacterium]|nr:ubiquinol-cytochrome c reductase iron-sulfur subunit [Fibrobacteria bacterium]
MSENQNTSGSTEQGASSERRTFLKVAACGVGAAWAGMVGYPIYRYIASPVEEAASADVVTEVEVEKGAELPKNAALMFKFGTKPAMLIHHDDDTWSAFLAVCTHLGCTPAYQPEEKRIFCPCHSGVYDAHSGANVAGPPPKPLPQFKVAVADGKVVVSRA